VDGSWAPVLRRIGKRHNVGPGQVAIAWTPTNQPVTGAIAGVRTATQAREIVTAAELRLSEEDLAGIGAMARAASGLSYIASLQP
jgi:aryl-alcohol dehydrogenase-like predicted oxidoreductase